MFSIMKQNGREAANVIEYVADTIDEISNLPTTSAVGSTCIITSTSQVFMLNNEKEWVEL